MKILKDDPISDHPGKTNVIELFDKFIHTGPNGGHSCIVNRPLGRSIERILSEFIWADPVLYSFCCRISIQALQALDLLHQEDIMHGDIHTGDFLLALTYNIDENTVEDTEAKNTHVDLGASSSPKDLPRFETAYSIPDRAPEILMDIGGATSKADSWALGCVLWCIVTRTPLFAP
ncbi:unnamed protein product [Penicillium manginii]